MIKGFVLFRLFVIATDILEQAFVDWIFINPVNKYLIFRNYWQQNPSLQGSKMLQDT